MLPVSSIAIHATGKMVRCHMSETAMGDVNNGSIIKQWDNDAFQNLRKAQRKGVWTDGCQNCQNKEQRKVTSKRIHWQDLEIINDLWDDIDWDNNLKNNKLVHLDIAFNNLCNFKCRMCSSAYSNAWIGDEKKLQERGLAPGGAGSPYLRTSSMFNRTKHTLNSEQLQELVDNGKNLRRVEILGGEPFLVPQFLEFLGMLRAANLDKQIELMITTNGSVVTEKHLEALEGFKYVNINLSLDGTRGYFSYIRSAGAIDWDGIVEKATLIKNWCDKPRTGTYKLNINGTFQAINALNIGEFIEWIVKFYGWDKKPPKQSSKNRHSLEHRILIGPKTMHVQWLSTMTLQKSLAQVNNLIEKYPFFKGDENGKGAITDARYLKDIKKLLEGLILQPIKVEGLAKQGPREFARYTYELDEIRGQSLKELDPEIYSNYDIYFKEYEREQKESFCKMPWHGLALTANDNIKPCCQFHGSLGIPSKDNIIDSFVNSPKIINIRKQFLNNEKPTECSSCWQREQLIGTSRRKWFNQKFTLGIPVDYDYDKPLRKENLMFTQMDINFSNVCNLKCRMCGSWASNQWFEEDIILSKINPKFEKESDPFKQVIIQQEVPSVLELKPHLDHIQRIDFKGGEPMLAKNNVPFLEDLIKHGFHNYLTLQYTTNGTVVNPKILQILAKFKNVRLMFSIEATGKLYSYIRGGKYTIDELESVIERYNQLPNVNIGFNVTLQAYNLLNLHHLHKLLSIWTEKYANVDCSNAFETICNSPMYLSPTVMPESLRNAAIKNLESYPEFKGLVNSLKTSRDHHFHWDTFKHFTKEVDKLRGENILEVIPELKEFWND